MVSPSLWVLSEAKTHSQGSKCKTLPWKSRLSIWLSKEGCTPSEVEGMLCLFQSWSLPSSLHVPQRPLSHPRFSVLGKPVLLHTTSNLSPDDEEIFLLSSNHSYSRLPVSCTLVLAKEKVNKLGNSKTQTLQDTYMYVWWVWSLLWAWIPFTSSSPKAGVCVVVQGFMQVGESCTASSNGTPIPNGNANANVYASANPNMNSCHRLLGIRMFMASPDLCLIWQPACLAPVHFSI